MMKIGLTGGVGSGKSTAAKIFEQLNIPVFYADDEAKSITDSSEKVKQELIKAFGEEIYVEGRLNRVLLAKIVFEDKSALMKVNEIIHPAVRQAFDEWVLKQNSPYVLQEAAILFETGAFKLFDANILVTAPEELRISRLKERNGWSRGEILKRMENQWGESQKIPLADFVILNDGKEKLTPQILKIHENLLSRANKGR